MASSPYGQLPIDPDGPHTREPPSSAYGQRSVSPYEQPSRGSYRPHTWDDGSPSGSHNVSSGPSKDIGCGGVFMQVVLGIVVVGLLIVGIPSALYWLVSNGPWVEVDPTKAVIQKYYDALERPDYATACSYLAVSYGAYEGYQPGQTHQEICAQTARTIDARDGKVSDYAITYNTPSSSSGFDSAQAEVNVTRHGRTQKVYLQLQKNHDQWQIAAIYWGNPSASTVVQQYYNAIKRQDYAAAYSFLDCQFPDCYAAQGPYPGSPDTQEVYTQKARDADAHLGPVRDYMITSDDSSSGFDTTNVEVHLIRDGGTEVDWLYVQPEYDCWKITAIDTIF